MIQPEGLSAAADRPFFFCGKSPPHRRKAMTAFFEAANAEIFRKISIFVTRLHVSGTGSRNLLQSGRRRGKKDP
ncbi:hypothetical protein [Alistipes communis]|uniref:hypothetical protein n=1 Tax=Alistipes communis TaxID=2585118 RepID=UPI0011433594|nr:hypothetical protein [Alistipes communis]